MQARINILENVPRTAAWMRRLTKRREVRMRFELFATFAAALSIDRASEETGGLTLVRPRVLK